ncbi:MAG: mandelate racemase/muconate lactonizing enzyme family protein [Anaerolineales bacterium]|nr:mandelate racemase/muconate lactonizing enzyme family protein [Anaerolineales bacterium]
MISHVDSRLYRIPLTHTMTDATHGAMTHFEVVMVSLRDDEGHEGIGYTYTIGLGGAAVVSLIRQALEPLLLKAEPDRINQIWEQMWWRLHYIGRGGLASFAMAAVDIALWDLAARRAGQPLWRRLGGNGGPITPYAGGIDLHLDLDGLLAYVQGHLDKGFRAVKIKVGQPRWQDDIARIRAVRELLGPELTLMVDANMRWDVATAVQAARQMQPYNVYWLEEPTIPDDVAGHARIAAEGGVPVATGENLHTIYEFAAMIEQGGIAYPEPDVSNIGGITNWLRVAGLAYAHNRPVTTHGVHELHLQLLGAIPNPSFLEVHSFGLERFILNPPVLIDGVMQLPEAPGHGVQFDWAGLAACEVRLP